MSAEIKISSTGKKSKERRDGSEKKSKKRKHHDEHDSIIITEETPAKKHKKEKKEKKRRHRDSAASEQAVSTGDSVRPQNNEEQTELPSVGLPDDQLIAHSPFSQITASLHLALSPVAQHFPIEGLCAEHISPLLLTYYPPLKGVVMAYSDLRLSEEPLAESVPAKPKKNNVVLSQSVDEYAVTYIWLTADFIIFRPQRGKVIEGYVSLQNESILGLVCYNYFNAGIERDRLPEDWIWKSGDEVEVRSKKAQRRGESGHFVDGKGRKVEGRLVFKVKDFEGSLHAESGSGTINVFGTLLLEEQDRKVDDELRRKAESGKGKQI